MAEGEWVNDTEFNDEVGAKNIRLLANVDSDGSPDTIERMRQRAMDAASSIINGRFKMAGYQIPLTPMPGKTLDLDLIRLCGAKIAHWQLYTTKGKRDADEKGSFVQEKYDWAMKMLDMMIDTGLEAVPAGGDTTGEAGPSHPGQMRTIRLNKPCDPTTTDEYDNRSY